MSEPPSEHPPTLDYAGPPRGPSGHGVGKFILGLVAGLFMSGTVYAYTISDQRFTFNWLFIAILALLVSKCLLGFILIRSPRWAAFGKGLFGSIGLIVLLLGACFAVVGILK